MVMKILDLIKLELRVYYGRLGYGENAEEKDEEEGGVESHCEKLGLRCVKLRCVNWLHIMINLYI